MLTIVVACNASIVTLRNGVTLPVVRKWKEAFLRSMLPGQNQPLYGGQATAAYSNLHTVQSPGWDQRSFSGF